MNEIKSLTLTALLLTASRQVRVAVASWKANSYHSHVFGNMKGSIL